MCVQNFDDSRGPAIRITSLPFVHTARRTYRLNGPVKPRDCKLAPSLELDCENLSKPYHLEEGEVVTRFP